MTKFEKADFNIQRGGGEAWVTYRGQFVARFKYAAKTSAGPFVTFLCRNFTVEEYFGLLDAGESPLKAVEEKGFVLSHIKKWMKRDGFTCYKAWMDNHMQQINARMEARRAAG